MRIDVAMMERCIALSKTAGREGEFPFACVIEKDGKVVVETTNRVGARRRRDAPCRDRRGVAGAEGARQQGPLGLHALHQRRALRDVLVPDPRDAHQPRRLCDRLAPDGRRSPNGTCSATPSCPGSCLRHSRPSPEIVRGFMRRDAEKAWRAWNPLIWGVIRYRGCFGEPPKAEPVTKPAPRRRSLCRSSSRCTSSLPELAGGLSVLLAHGGCASPARWGRPQWRSHLIWRCFRWSRAWSPEPARWRPMRPRRHRGDNPAVQMAAADCRNRAGAPEAARPSPAPQAASSCNAQTWPFIDASCAKTSADDRKVRVVAAPRDRASCRTPARALHIPAPQNPNVTPVALPPGMTSSDTVLRSPDIVVPPPAKCRSARSAPSSGVNAAALRSRIRCRARPMTGARAR